MFRNHVVDGSRVLSARRVAASLAVLGTLSGCATTGASAGGKATPPVGPEAKISVPRTVITPVSETSIPELYASAKEYARRAEYGRAASTFERVVSLDPEGELADDAAFEAAAAHDQAGELEAAATGYEQVARRFPESGLVTLALVRATRLSLHLEQWERAAELARRARASKVTLGPFELVLTYSAEALGRLTAGDEGAAETFIEKARTIIDERRLDSAGRIDNDLAPLYYALGELRRSRAEGIVFTPLPPDFANQLERRCQLLLDAQSAYSDAMRAHNAHWSMMAGYRVGELYHGLHRELMRVAPPASADTQGKRDLFEGAMRMRYSILLTKALRMIEHTLAMGERTAEASRSTFTNRLIEARAAIQAAIAQEGAALDRLPYSRSTLEAAWAELTRKVASQASPPGGRAP